MKERLKPRRRILNEFSLPICKPTLPTYIYPPNTFLTQLCHVAVWCWKNFLGERFCMANVKVGRIPIQISQFFWPSTWGGSGLGHFQGGKCGGLRAGGCGWRVCAGPPTNYSQHFKAARQRAVSSGWVHAGPPTKT
jgi:hypothetical protein